MTYLRYKNRCFVRAYIIEGSPPRGQQYGYVHYLGPFRLTGPTRLERNARRKISLKDPSRIPHVRKKAVDEGS